MVANRAYVQEAFDRFNREIFGGELPPIEIRMSSAKVFLGKLCYRRTRNLFGREKLSDFCLRINTRIDLEESELEDTIIHEMIHYYIAIKDIPDTSAHGPEFRRIMTHINRRYGRKISISHRSTAEQREQLAGSTLAPRVVGIVTLRDGRTCLKRIPVRGQMGYGAMDRILRQAFDILDSQWFFTVDPWFGQFPSSLAMKMSIVDRADIDRHLDTAHPLPLK